MNTISSRVARGLAVGAFAASGCMALAGVAYAQTTGPNAMQAPSATDTRAPRMSQGDHGMRGMHRMRMMRELARLKTSLRLTPEQSALWDRAEQQMKPAGDVREQMKARHERMTAMLDDPNFDPRKLAADIDSMQSERMAKRKSMRDAWFAVYDKLNPVQRGQVREFLRERIARGERMRGHSGWKHRGMRDGEEKGSPSAPR